MPKSPTHNIFMLRPPPGAIFTPHQSGEIEVMFARGRERETYDWLYNWLENYVYPIVVAAERPPHDPHPQVSALQAQIRADQAAQQGGNPSTSPNLGDTKLAAMAIQQPGPPSFVPHVNPAPARSLPVPPVSSVTAAPTVPTAPQWPPPGFIGSTPAVTVYGAHGPMTQVEIDLLPEKPIPGRGYVAPGEK